MSVWATVNNNRANREIKRHRNKMRNPKSIAFVIPRSSYIATKIGFCSFTREQKTKKKFLFSIKKRQMFLNQCQQCGPTYRQHGCVNVNCEVRHFNFFSLVFSWYHWFIHMDSLCTLTHSHPASIEQHQVSILDLLFIFSFLPNRVFDTKEFSFVSKLFRCAHTSSSLRFTF